MERHDIGVLVGKVLHPLLHGKVVVILSELDPAVTTPGENLECVLIRPYVLGG